jgi:hypothetical protein
MTNAEKAVLQEIVNDIQNLAVSLDSLEAILIRKGLLMTGEISGQAPLHELIVGQKLADLRQAIDFL